MTIIRHLLPINFKTYVLLFLGHFQKLLTDYLSPLILRDLVRVINLNRCVINNDEDSIARRLQSWHRDSTRMLRLLTREVVFTDSIISRETIEKLEDLLIMIKNEILLDSIVHRPSIESATTTRDITEFFQEHDICYITSNTHENANIINDIKKLFLDAKDLYISEVFHLEYNNLSDTISSPSYFIEKIEKFNQLISNYESIEASINVHGVIHFKKNGEDIDFDLLSSGEKRLISIFLNLIFSSSKIALIDEPEISLSLNYQSKLATDILHTFKNKKIFVATHAPFIYEDFAKYHAQLVEL